MEENTKLAVAFGDWLLAEADIAVNQKTGEWQWLYLDDKLSTEEMFQIFLNEQ